MQVSRYAHSEVHCHLCMQNRIEESLRRTYFNPEREASLGCCCGTLWILCFCSSLLFLLPLSQQSPFSHSSCLVPLVVFFQGVGPVYAKKIVAERANAAAGEVAFKSVSISTSYSWYLLGILSFVLSCFGVAYTKAGLHRVGLREGMGAGSTSQLHFSQFMHEYLQIIVCLEVNRPIMLPFLFQVLDLTKIGMAQKRVRNLNLEATLCAKMLWSSLYALMCNWRPVWLHRSHDNGLVSLFS